MNLLVEGFQKKRWGMGDRAWSNVIQTPLTQKIPLKYKKFMLSLFCILWLKIAIACAVSIVASRTLEKSGPQSGALKTRGLPGTLSFTLKEPQGNLQKSMQEPLWKPMHDPLWKSNHQTHWYMWGFKLKRMWGFKFKESELLWTAADCSPEAYNSADLRTALSQLLMLT